MNHIHQHKSHNTIDLDLQSLYSISIKGITMIVCSKLFSQSSKLANKRRELFIYRRGAHGLLKEGAPSGEARAAKCGEWAATSKGRHLSKRGAPSYSHMLKSRGIFNQSTSNHIDIVPFDLLIDFAFKFAPFSSPFILFLFSLG
jgi:hypothetical protein